MIKCGSISMLGAIRQADFSCFVTFVLFFVSDCIQLSYNSKIASTLLSGFDSDKWTQLDPSYLEPRWEGRFCLEGPKMRLNVFNIMAWVSFILPLSKVVWALSEGGLRKFGVHLLILTFCVATCMSELVSRLMSMGITSTINWVASDFNMNDWGLSADGNDGVGWRVLEMIYIMTNGE